jgi:hypothetical protein
VDLVCPSHGVQEAFVKRVQDSLLVCPLCNEKAERVYSVGNIAHIVEFRSGYDRMLDQHFPTKRHRDDYLRKENLTKVG